MSDPYILVVDDEPDIRHLVQEILEDEGYIVEVAESGAGARAAIREKKPRLVLLDIWMPDEDGVTLLKDLNQSGQLGFPVVMISGHGTVETAVEATRHGAVDFIEKPLSLAKLLLTVEKALQSNESGLTENTAVTAEPLVELVGGSEYNKNLNQHVLDLAKTEQRIIIFGPRASGKLLLAQHIHAASSRVSKPFIQLRCDSLSVINSSRELMGESGHGVLNSGYLEAASGGTLFLNDVEQLPEVAQKLLLDALQSQEIHRIGALAKQPLDVRFIASSTQDLAGLVVQGRFLAALYSFIGEEEISCLALREHPEDVPALLDYYVNWFVEKDSLPYRHFTVAAQNRLRNQTWPGNLLELKNLVQRLMILGSGVEIDVQEVDAVLGAEQMDSVTTDKCTLHFSLDVPLREARAAFERNYMLRQLQLADGNIGVLAKRVGMERTHLYRKLRNLDIDLGKARD